MRIPLTGWLAWGLVCTLAVAAVAQPPAPDAPPKLNVADELPGFGAPGLPGFGEAEMATFQARIEAKNGGPEGELIVEAALLPEWHIYSVTQPPKGPLRTKIELASAPQIEVTGPFKPQQPAKTRLIPDIYPGVNIEEHHDEVVWRAPIRLPAGVNPDKLTAKVKISGQVCRDNDSCVPVRTTVDAKLVGFTAVAESAVAPSPARTSDAVAATTNAAPAAEAKPFTGKPGPFKPGLSHGTLTGHATPSVVKPGETLQIVVTGAPTGDYHFYTVSDKPADKTVPYRPTLIAVALPAGWKREATTADKSPKETKVDDKPVLYYEGPVVWTLNLKVPGDAAPGPVELSGFIGCQTCDAKSCDPPSGAEFRVSVEIAKEANGANKAEMRFASGTYKKAETLLAGLDVAPTRSATANKTDPAPTRGGSDPPPSTAATNTPPGGGRKWEVEIVTGDDKDYTLGSVLFLAIAGGFLLNFMPCVLPVIGLKVMSFVNQAHGDRRQVFLLNLYYFLGLLSVFLALALFAAVFRLGWGEQFQSTGFNVALASIVFVFALSMLGVWEIPLPGFVGSGAAADAAEQEGPTGAFVKGALTTVLATPCTGPFMGTALAWAAKQPTPIIFLTFAALGLGMGFPYLVIGAFPNLLKFLPKPGAWMDTFKQVMGFVLMGTVVFIFSFLEKSYVVPTAGLLVGLGMGCWWIGKTPPYAETAQKLTAYGIGGVMATALGWLALTLFGPSHAELPWQPFSRPEVEQLVGQGQTVVVDFTADWCATCKVNEKLVLDTLRTKQLLESKGIVAIKADMTSADESTEAMSALLRDLGNSAAAIPYLVVFSSDGQRAIALSGPITHGMLSDAIEKAGPSKQLPTESLAGAR